VLAARPADNSKPRPQLARILSLAEAVRQGADVVITTGELFHVPLRKTKTKAPTAQVWLPRKLTKKGQQHFVRLEDSLWLAILGARLAPVEFKVLWTIVLRDLARYRRDDPVQIGVEELCVMTGFTAPAVHRALKVLEERGIIDRDSGGGRHHKNSYWVNDPEQWLPCN